MPVVTPTRVLSWVLAAFTGAPIAVLLAAHLDGIPAPRKATPTPPIASRAVVALEPKAHAASRPDQVTVTRIRRPDVASRCSNR